MSPKQLTSGSFDGGHEHGNWLPEWFGLLCKVRLSQVDLLRLLPVILFTGLACTPPNEQSVAVRQHDGATQSVAATAKEVETFCGDCHATPLPDTFPRSAWPREVKRGFDFYFESFRSDLSPPTESSVIAYYQSLAPLTLKVDSPSRDRSLPATQVAFEKSTTSVPAVEPPGVATITWLKLPGESERSLVFCDMRSGEIGRVRPTESNLTVELLSTLTNPSCLRKCDLNGDGYDELIVAELGSFTSEDHHRGALVWLRKDRANTWRQRLLVSGLGRVADVQPADFDRDGDTDLIVAEFGHLRTGRILLYENLGLKSDIPQFREHVVDDRHGCIHVPVGDLDGDGIQDVVALISQEHEVIVAYLGDGSGGFQRKQVIAASDPSFGSSGIQLVDLDNDADLDVLYSNGDTFGSDYLKPYHGVTWLENQGTFPFTAHRIAEMVGVQRALAADIDGDEDLDVVATGFMPSNLVANPVVAEHDSVIWLEQTTRGEFQRRSLETGNFQHAALELGDFDNDGDTDLAIGNFQDVASTMSPWLTIWWNGLDK